MRRFFLPLLFFLAVLASCERDDLVFNGQVTAAVKGEDLKIENGTHYRIFFMVMEDSCAETLTWSPLVDGPNFIEGGRFRLRPLSEIQSCTTGKAVTQGQGLIVYWWRDDVNSSLDVREIHLVIR